MKNTFSGALLTTLDQSGKARSTLASELQSLIRRLIIEGVVRENERLPSTRALAHDLRISRDTAEAAYQQLDAEGYLVRRTGSGTFVAELDGVSTFRRSRGERATLAGGPSLPDMEISRRGFDINLAGGVVDQTTARPFAAAMPDVETFPLDVWQRLSTRVIRTKGRSLLMYGDPQGYEPLRAEIWRYLATRRGVSCEPDQILILTSSQQALGLIATVLFDPGDIVAIENPGYHGAKLVFLAAGAYLKPISVDASGVLVSELQAFKEPVKAVYLTPSNQYPTGVTLSLERRLGLLAWARRSGSWIIEDDYDSEYRYDSKPVPSIQGLDESGNVLYIGTFNKMLFPTLRTAYLVLPKHLVSAFVAARTLLDGQTSLVSQAILHEFILTGHFTAHVRRMRQIYRARRDLFTVALKSSLGRYVDVSSPAGGLSIACYLKDGRTEDRCLEIARSIDVELPTLSRLYLGTPKRQGWLLGFAAYAPPIAADALQRFSAALSKEC